MRRAGAAGAATAQGADRMSVLDNPVWSALTTDQAAIAVRRRDAARFPPEAAPFFALRTMSPDALSDMGEILDGAVEARLFRPAGEPVPTGWTQTFRKPILQMVWDRPEPPPATQADVVELVEADAPAMRALAASAKPGPFGPATHRLGRFVGVREAGALVAMGGVRFRFAGFHELSAIAVESGHRRRGLARAVTARLVAYALDAGAVPLLHAFPDNAAAAGLYMAMGFRLRATLEIVWLKRSEA